MNKRLRQLIASFEKHSLDGFLVTNDTNIRYLSEFPSSESWLLVTPQKIIYLTDFRYTLEAKKGLPKGISVCEYQKSIFDSLNDCLSECKVKSLGYDGRHMSVSTFKQLKDFVSSDCELVFTTDVVEHLRIMKDADELRLIRQALKLNKQAFKYIQSYLKPGLTEQQILLKLEQYVKSRSAGFSFDPIVASGPNSCFPHARVSQRKIRNNEPVLIDMGIDINGYKSDLTRMFFLGKIPKLITDTNQIVADAQRQAISKIKPGMVASEIDQEARKYLSKRSLGKYFGHSLGHGVGLDIHENPRISQKSSTVLEENMIFTVEPAVYIPNKFGIRIEDMVLVTKNGCEVLSGH